MQQSERRGTHLVQRIWEGMTAEIPPSYIDDEDWYSPTFWLVAESETPYQVRQVAQPTPHKPIVCDD